MKRIRVTEMIIKENMLKFFIWFLILCIFTIVAIQPIRNTLGLGIGLLGFKDSIHSSEDLQQQFEKKYKGLITFTTDTIYDTGYRLYEDGSMSTEVEEYSDDLKSAYVLAKIDDQEDQYVTIEVPPDFINKYITTEPHTFTGYVMNLEPWSPALTENIDNPPMDREEMSELILPYAIQANTSFIIIQGLFLQLAWIIIFFFTLRRLVYLLLPRLSNVGRAVALYGKYDRVKAEIESELCHEVRFTTGNIIITKSWLVNTHKLYPVIISLDKIVWIYADAKHIDLKGIPVRKLHYLSVKTSLKKSYRVMMGDKVELEDVTSNLVQQYPYIVSGFHRQIRSMWKKNPDALIANIFSRK